MNLTMTERAELEQRAVQLRQIATSLKTLAPSLSNRTNSIAADAESLLFMHARKAAAP